MMLPRKVRKLVAAGSISEAKELLPSTFKALDKAAKMNIVHKNNASRVKSRLAIAIAKAETKSKEKPAAK